MERAYSYVDSAEITENTRHGSHDQRKIRMSCITYPEVGYFVHAVYILGAIHLNTTDKRHILTRVLHKYPAEVNATQIMLSACQKVFMNSEMDPWS